MKRLFQFTSLPNKILLYFLSIFLIALVISFGVVYHYGSEDIKRRETEILVTVRELKIDSLRNWMEERKGDINVIADDRHIREMESLFLENDIFSESVSDIKENARQHLLGYLQNFHDYQQLLIIHPETGDIILSTIKEREGANVFDRPYFQIARQSNALAVQQIHYSEILKKYTLDFSIPIFCLEHDGEHIIGILVARINPDISLYPLLSDTTGLGGTGETFILNREGIVQSPLRWQAEANLNLKIDTAPVQRAIQGLTGVAQEKDYRGENALFAYTYLSELEWGFITKQDVSEIYKPLKSLLTNLVLLFLAMVIIVSFVARALAQSITRPLREMSQVSLKIQEGNYSQRVSEEGSDEISNLAKTINKTTQVIERAINISKFRTNILENIIKIENIEQFFGEIIYQLSHYTESQVGVFYSLDEEKQQYVHQASVGMDRELIKPFDLNYKEGIVGQVLNKKGIVYLKNIPADTVFAYKTIPGNMIPREIIAFPLILHEHIEAVIILATIYPYHPDIIEMISQSILQIAITLEKLLNEEETIRLNKEVAERNVRLNQLNTELEEQTEELRDQKEELEHQNIELELQKSEIQETNRLKDEFLSGVSHELRTPLNSIIALSDLLEIQLGKQISQEQKQYLKVITRNGKNLLNLINDILDLSKIEAGKITILPEYFSLSQLITQVIDNFTLQAQGKGLELKTELPPDLPEIYSDRHKVNQILQNLLSNAVKYTEKGSVSVQLDYDKEKEKFAIHIIDTGIGIAEKDIPGIFDEFRQIDGSTSRKYEGTGLGLAIVSRLVQRLEGDILVKSQPGEGSVFTAVLPRKIEDHYTSLLFSGEGEEFAARIKRGDRENGSNYILVIEDNEPSITQISYLLKEEGFQAEIARGGEQALLSVKEKIPHGIILDLMMPEIDGFEVLKRLREDERTRTVPVLILTAKDLTDEEIAQLRYNKIQQLVFKGAVDRKELIEKIRKMLRNNIRKKEEKLPGNEEGNQEKFSSDRMSGIAEDNKGKVAGKARILVAEDNPDNLLTMKAVLKDHYNVSIAVNGEEVLQKVYIEKPDLILLDIGLPKIDGYQILSKLKEDQQTKSIPIIAVTARAMREEVGKILSWGCDDIILKPINISDLIEKIKKCLTKK